MSKMEEFKALSTCRFTIGQIVYPVTDPEQIPRIVTGIVLRAGGVVHILASNWDNEREYEFFEISDIKTFSP